MGPVGRHAGQLPEPDAGVFAARLLDPRPAGDRLPPGVADFESGAGAGGNLVHDALGALGAAGCGHHGRGLRHEYPRGFEHAGYAVGEVFEEEEIIIKCRGRAGTRPPSFCRKDFANKITPTQVQMFCSWVGAFLCMEGEIICAVVFILWFML